MAINALFAHVSTVIQVVSGKKKLFLALATFNLQTVEVERMTSSSQGAICSAIVI